jgi:ABC-type amino acid transport substrate-binding protein/AraC-like DNA-binding protein
MVRWNQEAEILFISLEPELIARAAHEAVYADDIELAEKWGGPDPQIQHIGLALKAELEAGGLAGRLYGESLANALAVHLLRRYSTKQITIRDFTDGLSMNNLHQVTEYINDNLEHDLSLNAIAATIGMSAYHFARMFKQSTGLAPHQYVIGRRLKRAQVLLTTTELTILEVCFVLALKSKPLYTAISQAYRDNTKSIPKSVVIIRRLMNLKWHQLILSLGCLLLIIACNNFNSTTTITPSPGAKLLKVATDPTFIPFEMQTANGNLEGFDIDLMNALAKVAGFTVQFESLPFDGMISSLQAKKVDAAISGITITAERLKTISFSRPYIKAGLAITVKQNNQNIKDANSLKGKRIAVQIGTPGANFAKTISNAKVTTFSSGPEFFQDLINGNVDAVLSDAFATLYAIKTGNLKGLKVLVNYSHKNTTVLLHLKTLPI